MTEVEKKALALVDEVIGFSCTNLEHVPEGMLRAALCRAIAATGYDLYLGHEFRPKGDPIAALKTTFAICDQG